MTIETKFSIGDTVWLLGKNKAVWRELIDGVRGPKTYCDDCRKFTEKLNHIQPIPGVHTAPRFPIITFQPLEP